MYAVERNNLKIIQLLLEHPNIDVNRKSHSYKKAWYQWDDTGENIVEFNEIAPLHSAVKYNNVDIVKLLLEFPYTDINNKTYYMCHKGKKYSECKVEQKTALHIAVEDNNYEMIKVLINHPNINPNILSYKIESKQESQMTALHIASQKNQFNIVKLLLDSGKININIKDNHGRTADGLATDCEVKLLLNDYKNLQ